MAELDMNVTETTETIENENTEPETAENAEISRLKADLAKQKAALDKATKEAAESKRALRAKQTAEESAAEAEKERQEAIEKELNELRKERAVALTSKRVYAFIQNEQVANNIAEALYGAEDVDAAVDAFNKAWVAKEKALRLEYGKIPPPGVGGADGPMITREQLDGMGYKERVDFATKHPEEYNKLMGRT